MYIDNKQIVTFVELDTDKEIAIKLREFAEYLGYSVSWNNENRTIELISEQDKIKITIDENKCKKNDEVIILTKSIYIDQNHSYIPQSFLLEVLNINTILIEKTEANNRVNGVYLATNNTDNNEMLAVIFFDNSSITVDIPNADSKDRKLILEFGLAVQKEEIKVSMDYVAFVMNSEAIIKEIIYTSLQDMTFETYESIMNHEFKNDFSTNMVEKINNALGIPFVEYFYITELTIKE